MRGGCLDRVDLRMGMSAGRMSDGAISEGEERSERDVEENGGVRSCQLEDDDEDR